MRMIMLVPYARKSLAYVQQGQFYSHDGAACGQTLLSRLGIPHQ
jgi:hypothetical protein